MVDSPFCIRFRDSLNIKDDNGSETNGRKERVSTTVITHGYSAPILESAEHDFYLVPLLINLLVIDHRSFRLCLPGIHGVIPLRDKA